MRPYEHYLAAEQILEETKSFGLGSSTSVVHAALLRAKVHATLALVVEGTMPPEQWHQMREDNGEAGQTPSSPA